jgi:AAA15 family ATPase/GTPase
MAEVNLTLIHINNSCIGKSSIVDAIMFAVGASIPGQDYKHLIHKSDGERHDRVHREMDVTLEVYDSTEKKIIALKRGYGKY